MQPVQTETDLEGLRTRTRSWLVENVPPGWRQAMSGATAEEFVAFQKRWFAKLVPAGYAVPHWPKEYGGGGASLAEQVVIFEEFARAEAPRLLLQFVSIYHAFATIHEWGTEAQRKRYLPGILKGELWCQGFSEPNAGSDLAALKTRAERKGDRYVINGQKVWSTLGQFADFCLLLARTDAKGPKQQGITFLLMDMNTKGITRRPIQQITGDEEFCEMFFDDVEVPVENRLGEENQGWRIAQTTLSAERGLTMVDLGERIRIALDRLVIEALTPLPSGRILYDDDEFRREIADVYSRIEELRELVNLIMAHQVEGRDVSGEASIVKLTYASVSRQFTDLGLRLQEMKGQLYTPLLLGGGYETGNWMADFLNSYQFNIAGGSNEIQRNLVSERVLGLPREPKPEAPRS